MDKGLIYVDIWFFSMCRLNLSNLVHEQFHFSLIEMLNYLTYDQFERISVLTRLRPGTKTLPKKPVLEPVPLNLNGTRPGPEPFFNNIPEHK